MDLWFYFGGAYILVWGVLIFYVSSIWKKQRSLISRVESLERHFENKALSTQNSNSKDN